MASLLLLLTTCLVSAACSNAIRITLNIQRIEFREPLATYVPVCGKDACGARANVTVAAIVSGRDQQVQSYSWKFADAKNLNNGSTSASLEWSFLDPAEVLMMKYQVHLAVFDTQTFMSSEPTICSSLWNSFTFSNKSRTFPCSDLIFHYQLSYQCATLNHYGINCQQHCVRVSNASMCFTCDPFTGMPICCAGYNASQCQKPIIVVSTAVPSLAKADTEIDVLRFALWLLVGIGGFFIILSLILICCLCKYCRGYRKWKQLKAPLRFVSRPQVQGGFSGPPRPVVHPAPSSSSTGGISSTENATNEFEMNPNIHLRRSIDASRLHSQSTFPLTVRNSNGTAISNNEDAYAEIEPRGRTQLNRSYHSGDFYNDSGFNTREAILPPERPPPPPYRPRMFTTAPTVI